MQIQRAEQPYPKERTDSVLHPLVREWFYSRFPGYTPPQEYSIVDIHERRNTLICSPTGSGKTLSAFLSIINHLVVLGEQGLLEDRAYCVYVSPLKALSNDIEKNLEEPLREIRELAHKKGIELPEIRIGKRTGDVDTAERARQLRKPPHIFITTPESLAIAITSPKFSQKLAMAEWVIVDEVHSLADNKRGVHLSLSLERLQARAPHPITRIGLSATIAPLEEVAKFLVGMEENEPRPCRIVDVDYAKNMDIRVISPVEDLVNTPAGVIQERLYEKIHELVSRHRTTLIFTNTRSATERVVHNLKKLHPDYYEGRIEAHHGSLSKRVRLMVEDKLKKGELKCVVTSTSLELGIDIGYVDLVILLGSPKSIARALQRIGRAGHSLHETSKGRIIVLDRDDLVECVVLAKSAMERKIDRVRIPQNPLDVLAQHLVGMALESRWTIRDAYKLVTRSYCYHNLPLSDMVSVLRYLAGHYSPLEERHVYGKIWLDEDQGVFGRRGKSTRPIYYTNIGTIPDESAARVFTVNGEYIGDIEEAFLERLRKGDRFVLAGRVYEFVSARGLKARVRLMDGARPTIPSWFSEQLPLSFDLAIDIGRFRARMKTLLEQQAPRDYIVSWLCNEYNLDETTALAVYNYFLEQHEYLEIPTHSNILVEDYTDEHQNQNIIVHALYGRKTNDVLSRVYAHVISKLYKTNVRVTISDNGFVLTLPHPKRANPRVLERLVTPENLEELAERAIRDTEILKRRFRHVASRAYLVLRNYKGKKRTVNKQLVNARMIYRLLERIDPGFPMIREAKREVLEDAMDIHSARLVLEKIARKEWRFSYAPPSELPSPFAHNLVVMGEGDIILMEDRHNMIMLLREMVLKRIRQKHEQQQESGHAATT